MIDVKVSTAEDIVIEARPTDQSGKRRGVEAGSFHVTSADSAVVEDGVVEETQEDSGPLYTARCNVVSVGAVLLTISADADQGEGVVTIEEQLDVTVSNPLAANLGIVVRGVPKP